MELETIFKNFTDALDEVFGIYPSKEDCMDFEGLCEKLIEVRENERNDAIDEFKQNRGIK